jgi:hypothetical protein
MKKKVSNFFQIFFSPSGENLTIIFSLFGIYALIKYNNFLYPKCMTQMYDSVNMGMHDPINLYKSQNVFNMANPMI